VRAAIGLRDQACPAASVSAVTGSPAPSARFGLLIVILIVVAIAAIVLVVLIIGRR
jgi:hypothetical protein